MLERLSDKRLRRWYRENNERWFNGRLPDDVDVIYAPVSGCSGMVTQDNAEDFILTINPKYAIDMKAVRITLLHEMVHIDLAPYYTHGERFQNAMKRLAVMGAFRGLW